MELNKISSLIIKSAIKVHKELGPGLLESVYQVCMGIEIKRLGLTVRSEVPVPAYYLGEKVHEEGFRMDLRGCFG